MTSSSQGLDERQLVILWVRLNKVFEDKIAFMGRMSVINSVINPAWERLAKISLRLFHIQHGIGLKICKKMFILWRLEHYSLLAILWSPSWWILSIKMPCFELDM